MHTAQKGHEVPAWHKGDAEWPYEDEVQVPVRPWTARSVNAILSRYVRISY